MKTIRGSRQAGFTLVEVIVTATIAAVVAGAVAALLSAGINLWSRARQVSVYQDPVTLELEEVCRTLRQALPSRRAAFRGSSSGFACMTAAKHVPLECSYAFDPLRKILLHKQRTLNQVIAEKDSVEELPAAIKDISSCVFSYGSLDSSREQWKWETSWASERLLPLAVKISLAKNGQTLERTVYIPAAGQEKPEAGEALE